MIHRRDVMIHCQTVREDQLDTMKEFGVIPSMFGMHCFYWGDWHRDSVLGAERAERISPARSALRRGMIFSQHHDAPVANANAIRILSSVVTRRTRSGDILGAGQCIPVDAALKSLTLWAAYHHYEEANRGSIEIGKLADFAVLDKNPHKALRVLETIKEGKNAPPSLRCYRAANNPQTLAHRHSLAFEVADWGTKMRLGIWERHLGVCRTAKRLNSLTPPLLRMDSLKQ